MCLRYKIPKDTQSRQSPRTAKTKLSQIVLQSFSFCLGSFFFSHHNYFQSMHDGFQRMSSQFRKIQTRIKLLVELANYTSDQHMTQTNVSIRRKSASKIMLGWDFYMLSPLIMYKPNTSCCTPSWNIKKRRKIHRHFSDLSVKRKSEKT